MYQKALKLLKKFYRPDQLFKHGFNLSPMYRRSVGRITEVSKDLYGVKVEIPLSYKNRNYAGSIFGGSLFAATDPIYMIQLIYILGDDYLVWDKAATIRYRRPARQKAYAQFLFSPEEIESIKQQIIENKEIDITKHLNLFGANGDVFAELDKTIYIASKQYYKEKLASRKGLKKQ